MHFFFLSACTMWKASESQVCSRQHDQKYSLLVAGAIPPNQDCALCFSIMELPAKIFLKNEHGLTLA